MEETEWPKICKAIGRSFFPNESLLRLFPASRISPSEEMNSDTTRSAPNRLQMERKGESVMSSIGERIRERSGNRVFPRMIKKVYFRNKIREIMTMPKSPLLRSLTPFSRILFTVLLIISCFFVLFLAGLLLARPLFGAGVQDVMGMLADFTDPEGIALLKFFQILQEFGVFILPPLLAAWFFSRDSSGYLKLNKIPRWIIWVLTVVIMVFSVPLIDLSITLNESMTFPGWLKGVESWMKETEDQALQLTEAFLDIQTTGGFLFNFLMIAILPAIGEEFLFRGLLQRLFHEWLRNIHIAILLSAILFGAMHLQFYGIIPRTLLGILFGYLFYWSGSLWIPVFAHFLNNGVAVTISFVEKKNGSDFNLEELGSADSLFMILPSMLITSLAIWLLYYVTKIHNDQKILS